MSVWSKTGSSAWSQINSLFVKTGSVTWTEMLGAWVKTGSSTWTRVFTKLLVPANTVLPAITGSTNLYGTLTGTLGSWTSPNGTNSYTRQWQRASNSGGVAGAFSAISGATSSTYTTTDSDDNKFICLRVTATNLSGSTTAQSYEYLITKYAPVALSTYSLSGVAIVGGTLSAFEQIGTWKGTTTITGDTSPNTFEYEWSWSDGTIRQSTAFNSINSNTYTIVAGDLGKIIRVRVTGTNSGGSDTTGYTSSGTVTSTYSFNFGNTLYVGSNGYIGLDSGGYTAASPGSGRIINIYSGDLVQYKLQEYSDSSNYYLYFRSYNYQSPLVRAANNAVDYQIKFYTNQPYCDIYIVRKGSSVPIQTQGPGYYSSGFTGYAGIPGPYFWGAGSVLRSYFNGTTGSQSAFTWTTISDTLWKDITNADIDDSFTSVITSANQQAPTVSQSTAPTAKATSNNSTTTVKYGDSITWAAGTYTNAASITSVLLYSTNTSYLVSTLGDTSTSYRTSNPYSIVANDPTGTPYVFAVRDTVVGTNGTTYYFYSNQITSALADAVAFSYNTGVGAVGGWSATVVTAQSGASYSIPTTSGYSINSSTGTVTVTGLGSNVSSSITVTKSVAGTNSTTAIASGTSDTVASGPTVPTGLSVTGGAVSSNLSTSLTRNSATNKTQSWTTATSQAVSVSWTKGTGTGTITSEVKWNQTGVTPGDSDSGTWTSISGSSQSDSNGGGTINYYWVRTVDGNSLKSAWVYAGSYTATSPSMTGFSIRIYRGNGSAFSSPTSAPSSTSTSGSYTYSGLTNRDASPDFGHYAWANGTLNGSAKTATSSTV